MAAERFSIRSVLQQLATLEQIIDALLKSNTPMSPIVKEKIEQAEKLIIQIPIKFGVILRGWQTKLVFWWLGLATQQNFFNIDREKELKLIKPKGPPITDLQPVKNLLDFYRLSRHQTLTSACESGSIIEQVPDDFDFT